MDPSETSKKSILIIGAGPGIGSATAQRFGREGWTVALGARDQAKLSGVVNALKDEGIDATAFAVDAADPVNVRSLVADVDSAVGGLSTVHYNAAVMRQGSLSELSDGDVSTDLLVNIGGALATVRAAEMIFSDRGGTILLTGGSLALYPNPDFVTLGIGKVAVRWLAEAMFERLKDRGIHLASVTVSRLIAPGSQDAAGVADTFWTLHSQPRDQWSWEHAFPSG